MAKNPQQAKKRSEKMVGDKHTLNPPQGGSQPDNEQPGVGFQEQDPNRRLGSFAGKGEHARTGNRGHQ